jgi:nucleotide-binding universal stress UspA family protein
MIDSQLDRPLRIYLAIDGSEHSWAAVELIKTLPLLGKPSSEDTETGLFGQKKEDETAPRKGALAEITLLSVLVPREATHYSSRKAVLEKAEAALKAQGLDVRYELLVGYPSEKLNNYASEAPPDLFLLGARGLRATLGILLGGVAQQLVEYASWPVLVVRAPWKGLKQILLVTDGSVYSQCALEFMTRFPLPTGVHLSVLTVMPPLYPPEVLAQRYPAMPEALIPYPMGNEELPVETEAEEQDKAQNMLKSALEYLEANHIPAESHLRRGDATTEIIDFIKESEVDLVVTGSRGLSGVKSFLLGSVSRKLVHYSSCSVLVVKSCPLYT